ncbi:MAG: SDR family oxidoreductase [Deltaproteobacteria bacterium]|nr:SDR family oxidoreductase [Deltaproteobacteria bacterium]
MAHTALITGASTGIGYALSRCFAADHHNLVLVARQEQRLHQVADELHREFGVTAKALVADLSRPDAPQMILDTVRKESLHVEYLVNNAGIGLGGKFAETDIMVELGMMQINMTALVHLTKLFLPDMVARRSGRIMNVSSTAAFQPGPLMAVYFATKSFVLSFSEAIANELGGTGVTVTALCPGPTESEFQKRAHIENTRLVKGKLMGLMTSEAVAKIGYAGFMSGKRLVIPGLLNKIGVQSTRMAPRAVATQITRMLQENH